MNSSGMVRVRLQVLGAICLPALAWSSPSSAEAEAPALVAETAARPTADTASAAMLEAEIRTTAYGVPHILAKDFAGAGAGLAYASAKTNICAIAEGWITANGERSKYFGPEEKLPALSALQATNLASDFFSRWIVDKDLVGEALRQPPPLGPTPELRAMVRGYVAGYNRYLQDVGLDNLPDERCRGQSWVRPITERDVYLWALHLSMVVSSVTLSQAYLDAAPPALPDPKGAGIAPPPAGASRTLPPLMALMPDAQGLGSNMIALGKDATDNGRGMLLANPHWFWRTPDRLIEAHVTIPGRMNVYGAVMLGTPAMMVGSTGEVAWSHTLSQARRYTVYELQLASLAPTSYVYDGKVRPMTPRTVTIEVRRSDGQLEQRSHTYWETHYGLVVQSGEFGWTADTAYAVRDVAMNFRWLNQELATDQARSVEDVDRAGQTYLGSSSYNTMAADAEGRAIFRDHSMIPYVTEELLKRCAASAKAQRLFEAQRLPVLDGARSACEWGSAPDAPSPGIFGLANLPKLDRSDYVANSNDSFWLNNPRQPLEGFSPIMGDERKPRSLRTRMGLTKIENRLAAKDGYPGNRFTLAQLEQITFDNRLLAAQMWRDPLVELCRKMDSPAAACDALQGWDLAENPQSKGAVLFRLFFEKLLPPGTDATGHAAVFTVPFDVKDPVHTPRGLAVANPRVPRALEEAIAELTRAQVAFDAPYGDHHYEERGGVRLPLPGGDGGPGQYNIIMTTRGWTPDHPAWSDVWIGSSFVMWMQFTAKGPVGRTLTTYAQSSDPRSINYADQTKLFSAGKTKTMLFDEDAIRADPELNVQKLRIPSSF